MLSDAPAAEAPPTIEATASGPEPRDGALDVGTLLPLTGELTFLGAAAVAGVELAVADVTEAGGVLGAPVGLRHGDSAEGSPGVAEGEVARLLGAGVDVVIGPLSSATAARVLPAASGAGALLVSPGSTSAGLDALDGRDRFFRTAPSEQLQGSALAELVLADGHRTVAIAARNDDYGRVIADALTQRLSATGGEVTSRIDYDPADEGLGRDVAARLDGDADAVVLVGLAETALVLDALVAAGEGPRERPVYGTDGNLGERLGDLVDERSELACLRGVLPVATPSDAFAERVRSHDPALADLADAGLDLAAESYDAVVLTALAAEVAGSDDAGGLAPAMRAVSQGGTPCEDPATCLALLDAGTDVAYRGQTGATALDADGNRSESALTVVTFDEDGHLIRSGTRRVRR